MTSNNRSKSKFDISNINLSSNANFSNDEFTKEFSSLSKSKSLEDVSYLISAIEEADYKKYKKLIKDHNATFIKIPERSLSPLHHAVTCSNTDIDAIKKTIKSVLQSGVDINHLDEDGNTPLMYLLNEAASQEKKTQQR